MLYNFACVENSSLVQKDLLSRILLDKIAKLTRVEFVVTDIPYFLKLMPKLLVEGRCLRSPGAATTVTSPRR